MIPPRSSRASLISLATVVVLSAVISAGCQQIPLTVTTPTSVGTSTTLPGSTASPTDPEVERLTAEAAVVHTQLALIETITVSPPPTGRPPTLTPAPFIPGIFEISVAHFGVPRAYAMSSLWKDIVNGERTLVYAGARQDTSGATPDSSKGLVVVQVYSADLSSKITVEYEAPGATGILTIVAVTDYRLTLTSESGTTLYFDVPGRQFVDSLTATVTAPTVTPLPTLAPTPTSAPLPTGYPLPTELPASTASP